MAKLKSRLKARLNAKLKARLKVRQHNGKAKGKTKGKAIDLKCLASIFEFVQKAGPLSCSNNILYGITMLIFIFEDDILTDRLKDKPDNFYDLLTKVKEQVPCTPHKLYYNTKINNKNGPINDFNLHSRG